MDQLVKQKRMSWPGIGIAFVFFGAVAPSLYAGFSSLVAPGTMAAVLGVITSVLLLFVIRWRWSPEVAITGRLQCAIFCVWLACSGYANYRLASLSIYMADVDKTEYAINPTVRPLDDDAFAKPFFVKHNCFTSYVLGAHLAEQGVDNIYLPSHYRDPEVKTRVHNEIGDKLNVDRYQYPPPFLLLPQALQFAGLDFYQQRSLWFAITCLAFIVVAIALVNWIGGGAFNAAWFVWPCVMAAPTTLTTLQIENVHFLIIVISFGAMIAFARKKNVLGGTLLAFATLSKVFPGILIATLLIQRKWRAVGVTVAAMVFFCGLTWLVFSEKPFVAFVDYHLPRLSSGDAFDFARKNIRALTVNASVMGMVYKLDKLGSLGGLNADAVARIVSLVYSALLVPIVVVAGIKARRVDLIPREESEAWRLGNMQLAAVWLALLTLGELRSPFLPWGYGAVVILWLMPVLAASSRVRFSIAAPLFALWLSIVIGVPLPFGPPSVSFDLVYTLIVAAIVLALCVFVIVGFLKSSSADSGRLESA